MPARAPALPGSGRACPATLRPAEMCGRGRPRTQGAASAGSVRLLHGLSQPLVQAAPKLPTMPARSSKFSTFALPGVHHVPAVSKAFCGP